MPQEIELKFALPAGAVFQPARVVALRGVRPVRRRLHSIYFDTPEFALMRAGVALRVRRVGRRWIQTVKARAETMGALSRRPEWEVPVSGPRPEASVLPAELRSVLSPERLARLQPLFSTDFERLAWRVELAGARIELALDRGWVEAGGRRAAIAELEFELIEGEPAGLFAAAEAVMAVQALQLEPRSKAQRGYQLAGALVPAPIKAARLGLQPGEAASLAWQGLLAAALGQVVGNVPGLLAEDDPEYLHQLRVGIRRLRTVLRLGRRFGKALPEVDASIRQLMQVLSPARDWDVFALETVPRLWPRRPPGELLCAVAAARAEARAQACAAVTAPAMAQWVLALERTLAQDPASPKAAARQAKVANWAAGVLGQRWRALQRRGEGFTRLDIPARHRLRIAAKRLRYALEPFAALYPKKRLDPALSGLGRLQDALGVANDAAVAGRLLQQLADAGALSARQLARAKARLEADAARHAQEAAAAWRACKRIQPFWGKPGKRC